MQVDLEASPSGKTFHSQLCIIGAGVAGLTLAAKLAGSGIDIHVLEAGGLTFEATSQSLYETEMLGHPHNGVTAGRFRLFGGSSTRWGAQLLPYTSDVLQPPSEVNLPEWPVTLNALSPYYNDIHGFLDASQRPFTAELLEAFGDSAPFSSEDVRIRYSKWAPFGKRNMAGTLGQRCLAASKVTVFTHANVKCLELDPSGTFVRAVTVQNQSRETSRFESRCFVLCAGTVETCRILLSSDEVAPCGIGNDRDQVGRYFHDHLGVEAATLPEATRRQVLRHFTPRFSGNGTLHTAKLEASARLRKQHNLLSVMAHFPVEEPHDSPFHTLQTLLRHLQSRRLDKTFWRSLAAVVPHSFELTKFIVEAKLHKRRAISASAKVTLHIDCEQRPQAASRITLGQSTDGLGMRRAAVDWRISEDERNTISTYAAVIDDVFHTNGLGDVSWHPELFERDKAWLRFASDTFHMMGGTRMGTCAANSVVDSNLKVHAVDNLYIASCSVFPTGGSSNPTFTMMALTLRLAERLRQQLPTH